MTGEAVPTATPNVRAEVLGTDDDQRSVLVHTTDPAAAIAAARRELADYGYDDGDEFTAGEPRLWRWIPVGRRSPYHGDYSRRLHPADAPGRGAFVAIKVEVKP